MHVTDASIYHPCLHARLLTGRGARKVALRNAGSGRWLCAEPSGRVVCDRIRAQAWEEWDLVLPSCKVRPFDACLRCMRLR